MYYKCPVRRSLIAFFSFQDSISSHFNLRKLIAFINAIDACVTPSCIRHVRMFIRCCCALQVRPSANQCALVHDTSVTLYRRVSPMCHLERTKNSRRAGLPTSAVRARVLFSARWKTTAPPTRPRIWPVPWLRTPPRPGRAAKTWRPPRPEELTRPAQHPRHE